MIDEQAIPGHLPEAYRFHLQNLYEQISLLDTQIAGLEHFLKPVLIHKGVRTQENILGKPYLLGVAKGMSRHD
ncbi:MAG: hypothetical protein WB626_11535 [Bacteroidota bacterium]